jgi:hypothetical protein
MVQARFTNPSGPLSGRAQVETAPNAYAIIITSSQGRQALTSLRNWSLLLGGVIYAGGIFFRGVGVQVTGVALITLALALRTIEQVRSGRAYARGRHYTREQEPAAFWRIITIFIAAIGIAIWLIWALLRGEIVGRQ